MGEGHIGEVAPDSAPLPLQHYQKGVIKATSITCDPRLVDHSVLLVGFGKSKSVEGRRSVSSQSRPHHSTPYWILKNSWGANWGEKVSMIYWGGDRAGQASPHLPALMSSHFLGLLPAAPREQYLWHHQVPNYSPSGPTS